MIGGVSYSRGLQYKAEYMTNTPAGEGHPLLALRNLFTCEAHNELMTAFLTLLADGELETAQAMKEEVVKLAKLPAASL